MVKIGLSYFWGHNRNLRLDVREDGLLALVANVEGDSITKIYFEIGSDDSMYGHPNFQAI